MDANLKNAVAKSGYHRALSIFMEEYTRVSSDASLEEVRLVIAALELARDRADEAYMLR